MLIMLELVDSGVLLVSAILLGNVEVRATQGRQTFRGQSRYFFPFTFLMFPLKVLALPVLSSHGISPKK